MSPAFSFSPSDTTGLWLIQVPPLVLLNFLRRYTSTSPFLLRTRTSSADTFSTTPSLLAVIVIPESLAARYSIPVPTSGDSGINKGTACLCMFDPIKERFTSSCSKKGIIAAATDTNCFGETSI